MDPVQEQDGSSSLLAELTREAMLAKEEYQARERRRKTLAGILEAAPERPALALSLVHKGREVLGGVGEHQQERLQQIEAGCLSRAQAAVERLERDLPTALLDRDLHIDAGSRHPRYAVDSNSVLLEVDTRKLVAKITPRNGDVIREALDPMAVADRVRAERDRLLARPFEAVTFYQALRTSYWALRKDGSAMGQGRVNVRDLATRMAGSTRPRLDEFAVDLGHLLRETQVLKDQEEQLVVTGTRDVDKGLLLHGMEQGGYVGTVELRSR